MEDWYHPASSRCVIFYCIYILIIPSVSLCAMEVHALYGRLSCVRVVTLAAWEVGGVIARQAAGCNGRWRPLGAFSTAGARRLRASLHYSSSHHHAIVAC